MECKYESFKGLGDTVHVLIETLWNVNANGTFMIHKPTNVLIETLWNVNEEDSLRFYYLGNSFNRNIFGM